MKGYLAKGYFQDDDKGSEALARTQVYLSKTKLENTGEGLAVYTPNVQIGAMSHESKRVHENHNTDKHTVWILEHMVARGVWRSSLIVVVLAVWEAKNCNLKEI